MVCEAIVGDTEPGTCTRVRMSAEGKSRHKHSSTFSPPRMPVSQSCTSTTRRPAHGSGTAPSTSGVRGSEPDVAPGTLSASDMKDLPIDRLHALDGALPRERADPFVPAANEVGR